MFKGKPTPATLQSEIDTLTAQVQAVPRDIANVHTLARALRTDEKRLRAELITSARHSDVQPLQVHNATSKAYQLARSHDDFQHVLAVLQTLEASEEYRTAAAVLDPLLAQIEGKRAQLDALNREISAERRRLRAEAQAAEARALVEARKSPEVTKARDALQALHILSPE